MDNNADTIVADTIVADTIVADVIVERAMVDRRDFLKLSGAGLSGLLLQFSTHGFASAAGEGEVAILYDASKCLGCRACERACKECNNLPEEPAPPSDLSAITWNLIKQRQLPAATAGVDETDGSFFNYQCMHCTDAACVMVCPTGALYKDAKGFVALDEDKCNGCGYCTQFCPFGVPHLRDVNVVTGAAKAGKCIFCCQNQPQEGVGKVACVEACPTGALRLGWRETLLDEAKIRVAELKAEGESGAVLYGEKEAGGLHRLSILLDEPSAYDLPDDVNVPITLSRLWQKIIQPLGSIAVGLTTVGLGINFLIARRSIKLEGKEE
jgi:formate dehydrogenase iron-sulfur subunit